MCRRLSLFACHWVLACTSCACSTDAERQQYKGSELSAWEMMEGLCDSMDSYQLRQNKTTHRRYFSKNYSEPSMAIPNGAVEGISEG